MVDAEEHRARRRDAFGVADGHLAEEEPDPEARHEPHEDVEAVRGLGVLAHGRAKRTTQGRGDRRAEASGDLPGAFRAARETGGER